MSKLMTVLGIVLAAIGAAFVLIDLFEPGRLDAMMIPMDAAATLLVGGVMTVALGNILFHLENRRTLDAPMYSEDTKYAEVLGAGGRAAAAKRAELAGDETKPLFVPPSIPGFGRKAAEVAAGTTAAAGALGANAAAAANDIDPPPVASSPSITETIAALDKAKAEIGAAFGDSEPESGLPKPVTDLQPPIIDLPPPVVDLPPPLNPAIPPPPGSDDDEDSEIFGPEGADLYVVEEKMVRGRPARILSDGTVEAETEEGWMRFENLEHLNEYLDG